MVRLPPRALTVYVDTREKPRHRLRFPANVAWWYNGAPTIVRITPSVCTLTTGDYAVQDRAGQIIACVEKKGSMEELRGNLLTGDHRRLCAEWSRMQLIPYRAVLLTFAFGPLFRATRYVPEPERVLDALVRDCLRYKLGLLHVPAGRDNIGVGLFLCHWFLSALQDWRESQDRTQTRRLLNATVHPRQTISSAAASPARTPAQRKHG